MYLHKLQKLVNYDIKLTINMIKNFLRGYAKHLGSNCPLIKKTQETDRHYYRVIYKLK